MPPNSRVYMIAGTQHGGAAGLPTTPGACANHAQSAQSGAGAARLDRGAGGLGRQGDPAAAEPGAVDRPGHGGSGSGGRYARDQGRGAAARRQSDHRAGRLDQSARGRRRRRRMAGRVPLRDARAGGRCRRQRDVRHPAAADRGAARDLYRLERLPRPADRIVRPQRHLCAVRQDPGRARGVRRSAAVGGRALQLARGLCGEGEGGRRRAGRRAVLLPADAARYVREAERSDRF